MASPSASTPIDHDAPLPYQARIRAYYLALGYETPYRWAQFDDVPFSPLKKPLSESTLSIVTTAAPFQPDKGDQGPGAPHNGLAKFFSVYAMTNEGNPDLRISHIAYDRDHTTAEDQGTYFPLQAFRTLTEAGKIGALGPNFYGLPTNRSHKTTLETDCPDLVRRCVADKVDVMALVPNCPVCHQSVSLAARALEEAGIATIVMACARDIVEHVGVPRLLFSDFPLGNAAGLPHDPTSQIETAQMALDLLASATEPRTTRRSPLEWNGAANWKDTYSNVELLSEEELATRRAAFDHVKVEAAQVKAG